jgi:hypothetical protein
MHKAKCFRSFAENFPGPVSGKNCDKGIGKTWGESKKTHLKSYPARFKKAFQIGIFF